MFQISEVKDGLTRLQPGQFLVMHGMPGSGKSVLAAEAIKDPEITLRVSHENSSDSQYCCCALSPASCLENCIAK